MHLKFIAFICAFILHTQALPFFSFPACPPQTPPSSPPCQDAAVPTVNVGTAANAALDADAARPWLSQPSVASATTTRRTTASVAPTATALTATATSKCIRVPQPWLRVTEGYHQEQKRGQGQSNLVLLESLELLCRYWKQIYGVRHG